MIDHYDWAGGREAMLRFGPDTGPVVVAAMPLFEEANRTRAFMVTMLRALAERGIASALPDLPGQGESLVPTEGMTLPALRSAFAAAARSLGHPYTITIRSGALLTRDAAAAGRWLFAPQDGSKLVAELIRIARLSASTPFPIDEPGAPHEIAGNLVSRDVLRDLRDAIPDRTSPSRLVRLESDPREADRKFDAAPLWRRAEPGNDPALAATLADDIVAWIRACEG